MRHGELGAGGRGMWHPGVLGAGRIGAGGRARRGQVRILGGGERSRIEADREGCVCEASHPDARALRQGKVRVQGENKSTNGGRLCGHPKTCIRPNVRMLALPMVDVSSLAHFL